MRVHEEAWHHLLDAGSGLGAEIALVQESVPPTWLKATHGLLWTRAWPTRAWGTGIVVKDRQVLLPIKREVQKDRFVAGIILIIVGLLVGPGGYSIFRGRRRRALY